MDLDGTVRPLHGRARLGDIASPTWQNLNPEKNEVRFVTRKTDRQMIVPLARPLRAHAEKLPAGDDPVQPLHPNACAVVEREGRTGTLSRRFGEVLAQAGLLPARTHQARREGQSRKARLAVSKISFHALRHSMVSLLKAVGASATVAMELAGHESPEINAHYTHLDQATTLAALDKLPVIG